MSCLDNPQAVDSLCTFCRFGFGRDWHHWVSELRCGYPHHPAALRGGFFVGQASGNVGSHTRFGVVVDSVNARAAWVHKQGLKCA